eukprot:CAMPEP_0170543420 /NCGR_PEP_ID=MMETSP0211-20121228/2541_1 /TAXON_ID=311385 /ORGANISM="Pseudokeronopsis sp., Strain OXSARD2" /LENGTH=89 /DNA_ID=CAMNT_0010846785 /DNA_START=221 /DNA_END=490 /DNA_ORIENTATION=+
MKDLASDYGVFERVDVSSMISGTTSLSMTTASGFNVGFSNNEPSMALKDKDIAFPLSPIKEQRLSKENLSKSHKMNTFTSPNRSGTQGT